MYSSRAAFFIGAIVAALFSAPGAPMAASGSPTTRPSRDSVTGTGTIVLADPFGTPTVRVNARNVCGNAGRGTYSITYTDGTVVRGRVTCLFVEGNTAYVIGPIVRATGPRTEGADATFDEGEFVAIGILDNDAGPTPNDMPDRLNFTPGLEEEPPCEPHDDAEPIFPIVSGDFVVVDGSPPSTPKPPYTPYTPYTSG
jgi:hypothetical protein